MGSIYLARKKSYEKTEECKYILDSRRLRLRYLFLYLIRKCIVYIFFFVFLIFGLQNSKLLARTQRLASQVHSVQLSLLLGLHASRLLGVGSVRVHRKTLFDVVDEVEHSGSGKVCLCLSVFDMDLKREGGGLYIAKMKKFACSDSELHLVTVLRCKFLLCVL